MLLDFFCVWITLELYFLCLLSFSYAGNPWRLSRWRRLNIKSIIIMWWRQGMLI